MNQLIIELKDNEDPELAIEEIKRLLVQGYTSGYEPRWYLKDSE